MPTLLARPVRLRALQLSVPLLALSFASLAVRGQDAGFYVGAGAGRVEADTNTGDIFTALKARGASAANVSGFDAGTTSKVFGGYRFNDNFLLEFGAADLGDMGFSASVTPPANLRGEAAVIATSVDLLGSLPLYEGGYGFLRLGAASVDIDQQFSGMAPGAAFADGSASGTGLHYGAGVDIGITDSLSFRLELEQYRLPENSVLDSTLSALTASVLYRFGRGKPAPQAQEPVAAPAAPAAAPAVPAPAPAPAQAPAPAAPAPAIAAPPATLMQVTLDASALFDLNSAELKDAGRQQLDQLVRDLAGVRYQSIAVTGHTDRLGPPDLNRRLSTERAEAVTEYLVSAGISADAITATGLSNDRPITTLAQCPGERSPALIACLQPDRRVEVEVIGTRDP